MLTKEQAEAVSDAILQEPRAELQRAGQRNVQHLASWLVPQYVVDSHPPEDIYDMVNEAVRPGPKFFKVLIGWLIASGLAWLAVGVDGHTLRWAATASVLVGCNFVYVWSVRQRVVELHDELSVDEM